MTFSNQESAGHRAANKKIAMSNGQDSHRPCRGGHNKELPGSFVPEVFSEFGTSQDDLVTTDVFGDDIFGVEVTKNVESDFGIQVYEENDARVQSGSISSHRRSPRQNTRGAGRRTKSGDIDEVFHGKSPVKRSQSRSLSRKRSPRRGVAANCSKTSEQESNISSKQENRTRSPRDRHFYEQNSEDFHQRSQTKRRLQRSRSGDACEYHPLNAKQGSSRRTRRQSPESEKRNSLQRARSEENLGSPGVNPATPPQQRRPYQVTHQLPHTHESPRKSPIRMRAKSQEKMRLPRVQPEELEKFRKSPKRDYNKILSRAQQGNGVTLRKQRTRKGSDVISGERQLEIFMDVNNRSWTAQVPVLEHFEKPAPGPWQTRKDAHNSNLRVCSRENDKLKVEMMTFAC